MSEREKELRRKIGIECWSFKSNFSGIDILMKMENDWRVAKKENDYSFENCPSTFDCLCNFVGLCDKDDAEYGEELCKSCWKKALTSEL